MDNDIVFTGTAQALRTNVGTSMMTLKAGDFANRNPNFSTVTFVVTNGYQTIAATPAVIRTEPKAKSLIYDGTYQELVTAGEADGGTIYYAVTQTPSEQPADTQYHTFLPLAKAKGTYYVWYRVKSDANHTDLSATFLKVILLSNAETTLTGRLYQSDGQTPVVGATVSLKRGNKIINSVLTDEDGRYEFAVLDGSYNLVAEHNGMTQTAMVMIEGSKTQDMILSAGKTESFLKVSAKADDFGVVAGGLDEEAVAIRAIEQIPDGSSVSVTMTVETKTEETAVNADPINDLAEPTKSLTFFDIKVEKTIDSVTTRIEETTKILEIAIPYEKAVKRGVTVYSSDGTGVQALQESDSKENGTYRVDRANGLVYIYSNSFSTFAIGYTPYYHLAGSLSLGSSFRGTANVTLTSQTDGAVYQLEGVALDNISFADIPKGPYMMTITWEDGTKNSITMPFTVSYNNKED